MRIIITANYKERLNQVLATGDEYLASIEFGSENTTGAGETVVKGYGFYPEKVNLRQKS